jgi:plastocyanin
MPPTLPKRAPFSFTVPRLALLLASLCILISAPASQAQITQAKTSRAQTSGIQINAAQQPTTSASSNCPCSCFSLCHSPQGNLLLSFAQAPASESGPAQVSSPAPASSTVRLRLTWPHPKQSHTPPAVLWLEPQSTTTLTPAFPQQHYTLRQKNREFLPHLQVVPVGAAVAFPNADPFFHNVFSLFDGKRFDLGLYEAGSTKSVTFSREGVSYIFCNIHPEMSAVVIALSTPLYAIAAHDETFTFPSVPSGSYRLHLWIEGVPLSYLDSLTRTVHIEGDTNLGAIPITVAPPATHDHTNKFGKPYDPATPSPY